MEEDSKPRRILIKISGEALKSDSTSGFSPQYMSELGQSVRSLHDAGYQLAFVIGGGNFFRGSTAPEIGLSQAEADQMGMLATVMNGIALHNLFCTFGLDSRHVCAFPVTGSVESLPATECRRLLDQGKVLVFSGGTGRPFFTTDTAAVSRSIEVNAELLIKGTKVDGVYSADPLKVPSARRFSRLSYLEAIEKRLQIMDQTAFTLAREYHLPIKVLDITDPKQLKNSIENPEIGTIIR